MAPERYGGARNDSNVRFDPLQQGRAQLALRVDERNQELNISGVDFVWRIGPDEGRAASDPFAPRPIAYPQFTLERHYQLYAMMAMLGCHESGAPNDHGGRPKQSTRRRAD